ncbi:MAG: hypothetical protein QM520_05885 [Gammaproteobacteria bacterium]|nr:hypothetical protein [Gammaproteobacteria bacterium]
MDGLLARFGVTTVDEFSVISGATVIPIPRQVTATTVMEQLQEAGLVIQHNYGDKSVIKITQDILGLPDHEGMRARDAVERITLDKVRDWARNIGAASYDKIAIRGEKAMQPIQQFRFDLAGPSYLLPLLRPLQQNGKRGTGFLVADVFSGRTLDEYHIKYFLRKAQALHSTLTSGTILPILVADGFTSTALKNGHAGGILMATPSALFGTHVGKALKTLLETLQNAAAYARADSPDRLIELMNSLKDIEGRAHNLRGPLFELLAAYLVRKDAVSIDIGRRVTDPKTRGGAEIDILKVEKMAESFVAIECKARAPGGVVDVEDVKHWLDKTFVIKNWIRQNHSEAEIRFEIWTTGNFSVDALSLLNKEKASRTRTPIHWNTGTDIITLASKLHEKAVSEILRQNFVKHPLATLPQT